MSLMFFFAFSHFYYSLVFIDISIRTCEKHRFKLSVVVKPTTRSSAMPQSYTDKWQCKYERTLGLATAVISGEDTMQSPTLKDGQTNVGYSKNSTLQDQKVITRQAGRVNKNGSPFPPTLHSPYFPKNVMVQTESCYYMVSSVSGQE